MINSVAGITMVNFLDNFFTIGVVAAILSWCVMYVTGTGKFGYVGLPKHAYLRLCGREAANNCLGLI